MHTNTTRFHNTRLTFASTVRNMMPLLIELHFITAPGNTPTTLGTCILLQKYNLVLVTNEMTKTVFSNILLLDNLNLTELPFI